MVSGGLVLGALGFQFLGGLVPCEMCRWQRWAHLAVIALAAVALVRPAWWPLPLLAMVGAAGLGLWHLGVEQGWWLGPARCAAPPARSDDLWGELMAAPLVRCDRVPWSFLGLSMAGWNLAVSAMAAGVAAFLGRRG